MSAMGRTHLTESRSLSGKECLGPHGSAAQVRSAFARLGGRWKLDIVFLLFEQEVRRFADLERALDGISPKVLAQQLRALERDGLVTRTVHAEVPPRVEYRLTKHGRAVHPALRALREWMREQAVRPAT
jgi:DNA-binding HxlR family transcriptional regulator